MSDALNWEEFERVQIHVGTVLSARPNPKAKKPSYLLELDFGFLGKKQSSAQLTENYKCEDLVGRQVIAVTNFSPKLVAGQKSEVLVLAAVCESEGTVLLGPLKDVKNGTRVL